MSASLRSLRAPAPLKTAPPQDGLPVALFDGRCEICTTTVRGLQRVVGTTRCHFRSIHDPGALAPFPGVTLEACMAKMCVVSPDGAVLFGASAIAALLRRVPRVGWLAAAYGVPGVRTLCDGVYAFVARRRYRLSAARGVCDAQGGCRLSPDRDDVGLH
jgi:predicted DCC family thiol-disulfide oxidoreductase YuxK